MSVQKKSLTPIFGALCFFFSAIEYLFPKPLPFLRLGLANLPLLVGLDVLTLRQFSLVVLIKLVGQGIIGGTLFSYVFLFSAAGTLSSACVMYALKKMFPRALSFTGIGIAGALASNTIQLLLARFILFGKSAWLTAPPFLALGTFTALFLGLFADYFTHNSCWFAYIKNSFVETLSSVEAVQQSTQNTDEAQNARRYFFAGLCIMPLLFFSPSLLWTAAVFACIVVLLLLFRRKFNVLSLCMMSAAIVFFNLLTPAGRVLFEFGGLRVTQTALESGLNKAITLSGLLLLSRWMIRPALKLPGRFGALVSQSFLVLERLTAQKKHFDRKNLIKSIDEILFYATNTKMPD